MLLYVVFTGARSSTSSLRPSSLLLDEHITATQRDRSTPAAELLHDDIAAITKDDRVAVRHAWALQVAVEGVDGERVATAVERCVQHAVDVPLQRRPARERRPRRVAIHREGQAAALPAVALGDVLHLIAAFEHAVDEERVAADAGLRVGDREPEGALAGDRVRGIGDPAATGSSARAAFYSP